MGHGCRSVFANLVRLVAILDFQIQLKSLKMRILYTMTSLFLNKKTPLNVCLEALSLEKNVEQKTINSKVLENR